MNFFKSFTGEMYTKFCNLEGSCDRLNKMRYTNTKYYFSVGIHILNLKFNLTVFIWQMWANILWDTLDEQEVILAWLRERLGNNIQLSRQQYSARVWDQHFCNRGVFQVVTISSGIGLFYQKANADKQIALLLLRSNCTLEECWTRLYKIGGNKAAVSSRSRTKTYVRMLGRDANTWTM